VTTWPGPVRSSVHVVLGGTPSRLLRPLLRARPFGEAFDEFHGRPLLGGYRDFVKGRWRANWWSTRILLSPAVRGRLDADAAALAGDLIAARTLPAPLSDYAEAVHRLAERMPGEIRTTERVDESTDRPVLELQPTAAEVDGIAAMYRLFAANVAYSIGRAGGRVEGSRVLDVGTGTGVAAHALADWFPAADVVGVDLAAAMIDEARRKGGRAGFEVADASQLPFPDASFDLVVLMNAVPFFDEIARVLAPGGYAVFSFSRGSETPIYVPNERLRRGLARRGLSDFAEFEADPATAFRGRKR